MEASLPTTSLEGEAVPIKPLYFISGLPRTGSTLLCNLLAQNPRFAVGGTSGLVDILVLVRNEWDRLQEMRAMEEESSYLTKLQVLRGIVNSYTSMANAWDKDITFDKSRSWLGHLEMARAVIPCTLPLKVIVPVRDIREILASMEVYWRRQSATRQIPQEAKDYKSFQSLPGRLACWMAQDGVVGIAYNRVRDAIQRGWRAHLFLLDYDSLTSEPVSTMTALYAFLEEPYFHHDYDNVEQVIYENDLAYGMPGLHTIRSKVKPCVSRWQEVLGEHGVQYGVLNGPLGLAASSEKEFANGSQLSSHV